MNVAVEETLRAAQAASGHRAEQAPGRYEAGGKPGDRRVGVVCHTQGSGKSLTMAFYAGRVILHPGMAKPDAGGAGKHAHGPQAAKVSIQGNRIKL